MVQQVTPVRFDELHDLDKVEGFIGRLQEDSVEVKRGDIADISMDDDKNFSLHLASGRGLQLEGQALTGLSYYTDMPWKFLARIGDPDNRLFRDVVRRGLDSMDDEKLRIMTAGGAAISIIPSNYPVLTVKEAFHTVREFIPPTSRVSNFMTTDRSTSIEFVTEVNENARLVPGTHVGVDDFSHAGLELRMEGGRPLLTEYVFRLVCTNGAMRVERSSTQKSNGSRDEMFSFLRTTVGEILSGSNQLLHRFVNTSSMPVVDPHRALRQIIRMNGISGVVAATLYENLQKAMPADPTYYDLVNLVTATARDYRATHQNRTIALQTIAGKFVADVTDKHSCGACGAVLN